VFDAWVVTTGTPRQAVVNAGREARQGGEHRCRVSVQVLPVVFSPLQALSLRRFHNFKLDSEGVKAFPVCMILIWLFPGVDDAVWQSNFGFSEADGDHNHAVAATERALARLRTFVLTAGIINEPTVERELYPIAYIEGNGMHASHSVPSLTSFLVIMGVALAFLCCLHTILSILWACHTLNHHYFDLSKLNIVSQAIAVMSQICTVAALGLLSYGFQRIAADKFIRQGEPTSAGCQTPAELLQNRPYKVCNTWNGLRCRSLVFRPSGYPSVSFGHR